MKNKWSKYALKDGKIQSSYIREYSSRSPKREAREASSRNSLFESREKQEEVKLVYRPPIDQPQEIYNNILKDAGVINLKGTKDGNDAINKERGSSQETGTEQYIQSSTSSGIVMDMQDVPGKPNGSKRKARSYKKHNAGSQEKKIE